MKKKTGKRIRYVRLAGVLLALGVLAIAAYGSFGAYTNFNSVKRVVSTGTQTSDTMFSSNYLSLLNSVDTNLPVNRISLAESGEDHYTFTVLICNYVWGDQTLYNPKDITYKLEAKLISMDGGSLPENITKVKINDTPFGDKGECNFSSENLIAGKADKKEYKLEIPKDLKDKIKIQITAEPSGGDSIAAVKSQKLAAILSFADYKVTKNWTGHFIDLKVKTPEKYDAFNYEISGNGSGTVTVTWDESLLLSKWAGTTETTDNTNARSCTFKAGDSTTAIQFQFYRNPEKTLDGSVENSWEKMEKLVTVTFVE